MPRVCYVPKRFSAEHRDIIDKANIVCDSYAAQGLVLTLRQLYYQFVVKGWLPNEQRQYKRLGDICAAARMAGEMDWHHLIDRTRNLVQLSRWDDPEHLVKSAASQYRTDRWADQGTRVEVWIEKDAGIGVIESVCAQEDVPYFSCRGYTSMSELWEAAQRIRRMLVSGQDVVVLHIGDHDPSGVDMSRDIEERLRTFLDRDCPSRSRSGLEVRRIALTFDQVQTYEPPPNPAKTTDSRFERYMAETGLDESWELDALDPTVLQGIIRDHIEETRDPDAWEHSTLAMESEREHLISVADRWDEVVTILDH